MSQHETLLSLLRSWCDPQAKALHSMEEIKAWLNECTQSAAVQIKKIPLSESSDWSYDRNSGRIERKGGSFFSIAGLRTTLADHSTHEQPIIVQPEVGFLGILCREFDGVMHLLMQAKVEPGNINLVQISPTLQATRSNYTRAHDGNAPPLLDYFLESSKHEIIFDTLQSEQSSRFYRKRNRNLMLRIKDEPRLPATFCWMTLRQLKELMGTDNLVNMDTRTVISGLPFHRLNLDKNEQTNLQSICPDPALLHSLWDLKEDEAVPILQNTLSSARMLPPGPPQFVPLHELQDWHFTDGELCCAHAAPFSVVCFDIDIPGREVPRWTQPLLASNGPALFALMLVEEEGLSLRFLVCTRPEPGCRDLLEIGPSVQCEPTDDPSADPIAALCVNLPVGSRVLYDHLLSEEGGRFYQEQNRNLILKVHRSALPNPLPPGYTLASLRTLLTLLDAEKVNIQLRNLLSLLEF